MGSFAKNALGDLRATCGKNPHHQHQDCIVFFHGLFFLTVLRVVLGQNIFFKVFKILEDVFIGSAR